MVEPLKWKRTKTPWREEHETTCIEGRYLAGERTGGGWTLSHRGRALKKGDAPPTPREVGVYPTLDEAKAAAETDRPQAEKAYQAAYWRQYGKR